MLTFLANSSAQQHSDSGQQTFSIRRTDRHTNILFNTFRELLDDDHLYDCSLVCDGKILRSHKFLLASASPYFRAVFNSFPGHSSHNTAILIPSEVPFGDLKIILDFLYRGEVLVEEKQFSSLQKSINVLKVTCLLSTTGNQSLCKPSQSCGTGSTSASTVSVTNVSGSKRIASINGTGNGGGGGNNGGGGGGSSGNGAGGSDDQQQQSSALSSLINGHHQYVRSGSVLYPNIFSGNRTSHMLKVITPPTGPAKVVYQPHEPFVQLRELLRRPSKYQQQLMNQNQSNQQQHHNQQQQQQQQQHSRNQSQSALDITTSSNNGNVNSNSNVVESSSARDLTDTDLDADLVDDKDDYLSGGEFDMDTSRSKHDNNLDSDPDENGDYDDVNESSQALDDTSGGGVCQRIISDDLDDNLSGGSGGNQSDRDGLLAQLDEDPAGECMDLDGSDRNLSHSLVTSSQLTCGTPTNLSSPSSYSVLPLTVNIASFNSATARAIAASTTLAVASGLLGNSNPDGSDHHSHHSHHSHHHHGSQQSHHHTGHHHTGHHHSLDKSSMDSDGQQLMPLKRGRGRPPRHLRDDESSGIGGSPIHKTYKVRPILPSASSDMSPPPGIIISSEPNLNSMSRKRRISLDTLIALKGRKHKLATGAGLGGNVGGSGNGGGGHADNGGGNSSTTTAAAVNGKNVCPYCPQVYYSNQAMNDHINNVHTGNSIKYTCDICSKEFSWKISLTKHLRNTHKQEKQLADQGDLNEGRKSLYINY
ncbi:uncharacterized protein LOC141856398 [Brevipalpus obovatus]|uniref:uncharacterized protein LOC141856398 n=1 Tax=Brevipalpus obovatus TaxID=246614 RepID=UPI003D9DBFD9